MKALALTASTCAAAAIAFATPSESKVYKYLSNGDPQGFAENGPVELTPSGATTANFKLSSRKFIVVTFSAACAVAGAGNAKVQILVDNVARPANNPDFFFCTHNSFTSATATAAMSLPSGKHSVRIAITLDSTPNVLMTDTTLLITD
jgi:hypothetical protein